MVITRLSLLPATAIVDVMTGLNAWDLPEAVLDKETVRGQKALDDLTPAGSSETSVSSERVDQMTSADTEMVAVPLEGGNQRIDGRLSQLLDVQGTSSSSGSLDQIEVVPEGLSERCSTALTTLFFGQCLIDVVESLGGLAPMKFRMVFRGLDGCALHPLFEHEVISEVVVRFLAIELGKDVGDVTDEHSGERALLACCETIRLEQDCDQISEARSLSFGLVFLSHSWILRIRLCLLCQGRRHEGSWLRRLAGATATATATARLNLSEADPVSLLRKLIVFGVGLDVDLGEVSLHGVGLLVIEGRTRGSDCYERHCEYFEHRCS